MVDLRTVKVSGIGVSQVEWCQPKQQAHHSRAPGGRAEADSRRRASVSCLLPPEQYGPTAEAYGRDRKQKRPMRCGQHGKALQPRCPEAERG